MVNLFQGKTDTQQDGKHSDTGLLNTITLDFTRKLTDFFMLNFAA